MRQLELNAAALMLTTLITAGVGLIFWGLAAGRYDSAFVGRSSAELSAIMLLAALCQLNLSQVFPRFIPTAGARTREFVLKGYASTVSLSIVAGTVFSMTRLGDRLIIGGTPGRVLFVGTVALVTIFVLQDSVLTGLRQAKWIPLENVCAAILRVLLVIALASTALDSAIVLAWVVPMAVAAIGVNLFLFGSALPKRVKASEGRSDLPERRTFLVFAAAEYANGLVTSLIPLILPLMVVVQLGDEANAYFYVPWLINSSINVLVINIATSLIVEAAHDVSRATEYFRRAMKFSLLVAIPAATIEFIFAPQILGILGPEYVEHGVGVSRLLALYVPFNLMNILYASMCRIDRTIKRLAAIQIVTGSLLLGVSWVLMGHFGVKGPALAYLLVQGTSGLILGFVLRRRLRRPPPAPLGPERLADLVQAEMDDAAAAEGVR